MGNELTIADMALVQAAIDEANASMGRALAVIENTAARLGASPCGGCDPAGDEVACGECQGEDFGDCASCAQAPAEAWWVGDEPCEPSGRVYGGGGHGQDS